MEKVTICKTCNFELFHPIAQFKSAWVGLYDDARFPGRCIVALKEHFEHLDEIPLELHDDFWWTVKFTGKCIREVTQTTRVNYAVLGNVIPHVHAHVIPRGSEKDNNPHRPPWEGARVHEKLAEQERIELCEKLRHSLG